MPSMEVALVDGNRAAPAPRRKGLCPLCRLNAALLFVGTGLMLAVGITTLGWKTKAYGIALGKHYFRSNGSRSLPSTTPARSMSLT